MQHETPAPLILAVNPGGLSTKLALFEGDQKINDVNLLHPVEKLKEFESIVDQLPFRMAAVEEFLAQARINPRDIKAVSGRGGPFNPLRSGVYAVNEAMVKDIMTGNMQLPHASSLGPLIADQLSRTYGMPAFMVDPVSVDEMAPWARLSGLKGLDRRCVSHALNTKYVARKVAAMMGSSYDDLRMVVAHMGSGISVTAHLLGRMIDVNDAMNGGPFSTQRTGGLPVKDFADLCFSGRYTHKQVISLLIKEGGVYSYLGISDGRELVNRATGGDAQADLVLEALCYQVAKEIGAMAATVSGKLDVIILTGGLAHSRVVTRRIVDRVKYLGPVEIFPGEFENEALAEGALKALAGQVAVLNYPAPPQDAQLL